MNTTSFMPRARSGRGRNKTLLTALLMVMLCASCSTTYYRDGTGREFSHVSFGNRRTVKELRMGDAVLKGYSNDQVEGISAIAEGVAAGLVKGAKP